MISVCMATYNGEKYVLEQVQSILKQLDHSDELIISDDGSTDNTVQLLQDYQDNRIRIIVNQYNHGYTGNFYNALKYAKGDYIFLADQDDVWLDNKVQVVMDYLQMYDFVHTNSKIVDTELKVLCNSRNSKYGVKKGYVANLLRSRYIGCCMAFKRRVLDAVFPVPTYTNDYPHDLWIALISERYFKTALIDEPLMLYRRHGDNVSDGGEGLKKGNYFIEIAKKIMVRFYYAYYVIKQYKKIIELKLGGK